MRYSVVRPNSNTQGYWAHLDSVAGIAADGDHDAVR
jgi:predicted RNase H-like HicB family nuclease